MKLFITEQFKYDECTEILMSCLATLMWTEYVFNFRHMSEVLLNANIRDGVIFLESEVVYS
jgi:hypothetical protein